MNRVEGLLQYGSITMTKEKCCYNLVFEPDVNKNPSYKRTAFLITRKSIRELFDALEVYVNDQYRGTNDYPTSFFDPDGLWIDGE